MRTTYPAIDGGKCDQCMKKGEICTGIAGRSCDPCAKLHSSCSNSSKFYFPYHWTFTTALFIVVQKPRKSTSAIQSKAQNRHPKASVASSSKCKVNDVREDEDENADEISSSASCKKANTTDDDALSRSDEAEFIGELLIEIEGMKTTFDRVCNMLANFSARRGALIDCILPPTTIIFLRS
jgi:hypothetical protein